MTRLRLVCTRTLYRDSQNDVSGTVTRMSVMHTHMKVGKLTRYGPSGGLRDGGSTFVRRLLHRHTYRLNVRSTHFFSLVHCGQTSVFRGRLRKLFVCHLSSGKMQESLP